jgi:hypothetical protein
MCNEVAAVLRAGVALGVGVWLTVAALSAQPGRAQQPGFAAVAVSPSTLDHGSSAGTTSQASVEVGSLRSCQAIGARTQNQSL